MNSKILKSISSESKWKIIESLAKKEMSATELAKHFRTSLSNISQQISELESLNMIKKAGIKKGARRPFVKYSLDKGFIFFAEAVPKEARKIFLDVDENVKIHLRIWSIPQKEFHYFVESFWWKLQDYLDNIVSFAIFGSVAKGNAREDSDIDVLLIAKKNAKELDKRFSAKIVGLKEKGKMTMSQVFSPADFEEALKESKFAEQIISSMIVIYDKNDFLYNLREKYG
ncbi:ArsR family transcriptional regulator [archaeon]|nr:MAG: ArsR family transcriptional regulator [archaeon]